MKHQFNLPRDTSGAPLLYLAAHSLGPIPLATKDRIMHVLSEWEILGVLGHSMGSPPWMERGKYASELLAPLVGSSPEEVVAMNALSVNLHLLLTHFYQPSGKKCCILTEDLPFISDRLVVESQLANRKLSPQDSTILWQRDSNTQMYELNTYIELLEKQHDKIALVLLPGVHFQTGQVLPMQDIVKLAHSYAIPVVLDLAHAVGAVELHLADWEVDGAAWCSYKYLNGGPGAIGGLFVHSKHANQTSNRLLGWWGNSIEKRFDNHAEFSATGASSWQISNPSILLLETLIASLEVFKSAGGINNLRSKSLLLTNTIFSNLSKEVINSCEIITPLTTEQRGNLLSFHLKPEIDAKLIQRKLLNLNVICDTQQPNILRIGVSPLYHSCEDMIDFCERFERILSF